MGKLHFKMFNKDFYIKKYMVGIFSIIVVIILTSIGVLIIKNKNSIINNLNSASQSTGYKDSGLESGENESHNIDDKQDGEIKVYITGCIKCPGVITGL